MEHDFRYLIPVMWGIGMMFAALIAIQFENMALMSIETFFLTLLALLVYFIMVAGETKVEIKSDAMPEAQTIVFNILKEADEPLTLRQMYYRVPDEFASWSVIQDALNELYERHIVEVLPHGKTSHKYMIREV